MTKSDASRPALILDGGALLFKHATINPAQEAQEKLAAATIVEAYNLIGYQAVGVGSQDLAAGLPYLMGLRKAAKFSWLSANLVRKSDHTPLFSASTTVQVGKLKVGVIGLTGPAILAADDEAVILAWDQVLPDLVGRLGKDHDLIILLSNLAASENQRIAEAYDTIHLIIQSGAAASFLSAEPVNNTVVINAGPQGKQVGVMEIDWQSSKRWDSQTAALLATKKAALERLEWQLGQYRQDKDPEIALRNLPDQLKAYRILLAQEPELRGEVERLAKEVEGQGRGGETFSTYSNRFLDMERTLPDQPQIVTLTDTLKTAIVDLGQRQRQASPTSQSPYLGSKGCGTCHPSQLAAWQKTRHAAAYATLTKRRQQQNPNCLPCHVTGVPVDQGAAALSLPEERRGVGCETCHGPGRSHGADPKANTVTRRPGPDLCRSCHFKPHDESFDYEKRIKAVDHHK